MALSKVEICNLAIGWLGGTPIISIDDNSEDAGLCKANYDSSRDAVLEERNWTFATARKVLTPSSTSPAFGFTYAMTLPSDLIRVVEVSQNPFFTQRIEWEKEGMSILCDASVAYLKYVYRVEDETKFTAGFAQAFAARLAMDIALALTNSPDFQQQMQQLYAVKLERAGAMDGMQGQNRMPRHSRLIEVR